MSLKLAGASTAFNLTCAGAYCFMRQGLPQKTLFIHSLGIEICGLLNGSRPYLEKYLRERFGWRKFDLIYSGASAGVLAGVLFKTGISFSSILPSAFVCFQLGVHCLLKQWFCPISKSDLDTFTQKPYEAGKYLTSKLFAPMRTSKSSTDPSCSAYLFIVRGAFMLILAAGERLPIFEFTGAADPALENPIYCAPWESFSISKSTYDAMVKRAKQVKVKELDASYSNEQWELDKVPPLVCIQGTWNKEPNLHGEKINWDQLLSQGRLQSLAAFELNPAAPTWERIPQNPQMKGLSFNHSKVGFNIWVHEKNPNAKQEAISDTRSRKLKLIELSNFIRAFEKALFKFRTTNQEDYTDQDLRDWVTLVQQIPFYWIRGQYDSVSAAFRAYKELKKNKDPSVNEKRTLSIKELIKELLVFFERLPTQGHFKLGGMASELFLRYQKEFLENKGLVRTGKGFIDTKTLQEWVSMLKYCKYFIGPFANIDELINLASEYLAANRTLRIKESRDALAEEEQKKLADQRKALENQLPNLFDVFFQKIPSHIEKSYGLLSDLQTEISKLEQLEDDYRQDRKRPRSSEQSTAQIAYTTKAQLPELQIMLLRGLTDQVNCFRRYIESSVETLEGNIDLNDELCNQFDNLREQVLTFMKEKAQSLEYEREDAWEDDGFGNMIANSRLPERLSDGSQYEISSRTTIKSRDVFFLLRELIDLRKNQYDSILQSNAANYIKSPFLEREVNLLVDIVDLQKKIAHYLKVSYQWTEHAALGQTSSNIKQAKDALESIKAGRPRYLYKRIADGGSVLTEVVKNPKTTTLERRQEVHNKVYRWSPM